VTQADPPAEELLLVENLLTAMTARKFDIAKYQDQYTAKLTRLIEARSQERS
jgi:non-homologous end joining protein Ku